MEKFDVFLCHNSEDKPFVKKIGKQLKKEGLHPWLDEWNLRPGLPWQDELGKQIQNIRSAAVFVGKNGMGPWQHEEQNAFIRQFVKRKCPVIPVILKDCEKEPELPPFLEGMTFVDFRKKKPDPIKRLIWGITGEQEADDDDNTEEPQGSIQKSAFRVRKLILALIIAAILVVIATYAYMEYPKPSTPKSWKDPLTSIEFIQVSGGDYEMGCVDCDDWEKPVHEVHVSSFWMSRQEVTPEQWNKVIQENPAPIDNDASSAKSVSWNEAEKFIEKLNKMAKGDKLYRLPTEEEWEYACREAKGLEQMQDNVREWCENVFGPYDNSSGKNPQYKVVRGGRYRSGDAVRCTYRIGVKSSDRGNNDIGFRVVRDYELPEK